MKTYDVIVEKARTGEQRILDTIKAEDQIAAKKKAVRAYFTEINMMFEHLIVKSHTTLKEAQ